MTPDDLRTLGEAMYGPRWQSQVARDVGVQFRTVARWAVGDTKISPEKAGLLRSIARDRIRALSSALSGARHS